MAHLTEATFHDDVHLEASPKSLNAESHSERISITTNLSGYDFGIFYSRIHFSRSDNFIAGVYLETGRTFNMEFFLAFSFS